MKLISKAHSIFLHILLTIIFASCSSPEAKIVFDLQKMPAIHLEGELMEEELLTPYTKQMSYIQSHLFHFTPQYENVCLVTDEKADTIGNFGSVGGGPGELNDWAYFSGTSISQDTIYMYDTRTLRVFPYHVNIASNKVNYSVSDSVRKLKEKATPEGLKSSGIYKLRRLQNGYYVGLRMLSKKDMFTLFDSNLNEVARFGEYPIANVLQNDMDHFTTYFDGYMETCVNSFYFGIRRFAYMARYDISDDGKVTKAWDGFYAKVACREENNGLRFYGDSNIEGFYAFTVGKKYIYAAYSGVKSGEMYKARSAKALYPKNLVVFDLNGRPLAKFCMDKCFVPLCLDDQEEYLYIQHGDPDTSLWRYKVSDILKHL